MVVALIDDENVTLKKYYPEGSQVRLQPANETLAPIFVDSDASKDSGCSCECNAQISIEDAMNKVYYIMIKGKTLESRDLKELLARAVAQKRNSDRAFMLQNLSRGQAIQWKSIRRLHGCKPCGNELKKPNQIEPQFGSLHLQFLGHSLRCYSALECFPE